MIIYRQDLDWAVKENLIDEEVGKALWQAWTKRKKTIPQFNVPNFVYYFGALIVIFGTAFVLTDAWQKVGDGALFLLSTSYIVIFSWGGGCLWFQREDLRIPAGLLVTIAVSMVPLAIYDLQEMSGIWSDQRYAEDEYRGYHRWIKSRWFYLELGTIVAASLALRWVRFPFLTAPLAYKLWYMSMDVTPVLYGESFTWNQQLWVNVYFGVATMASAFWIDSCTSSTRLKGDFAFWIYLYGLMSFWFGLTLMGGGTELGKFCHFAVNLFLLFLSLLLRRRVFVVFGGMGVVMYLGHLAIVVFRDSLLFPIAVSGVGVIVMMGGSSIRRMGQDWRLGCIAKSPSLSLACSQRRTSSST